MEIIKTDGVDIRSWCSDIEDDALTQMKMIAKLPFVKHISLMPDCHLGSSACIGSVVACAGVVVPNMVGSDAACGMSFMKTSLTVNDLGDDNFKKKLHHSFGRSIPVGFNHNSPERMNKINDVYGSEIDDIIDSSGVLNNTKYSVLPINECKKEIASQLGTLGGG